MIDGITSRPFSATTIAPAPVVKDDKKREKIIKTSRLKYAHPVKTVEGEINRWAGSVDVLNVSHKSNAPRSSDSTKLYDVKCSNCGKDTKVIFEPVAGRLVYCKNCLKKMKPDKSPRGHFDGPATISPKANLGGESEGSAALGDLGIEFAPSPSSRKGEEVSARGGSAFDEKLENIPFHNPKKKTDKPAQSPAGNEAGGKPKRKEINLADLRKALEESLEKKDLPAQAGEKIDKPSEISTTPKIQSIEEELKQRIEEEREEDKMLLNSDNAPAPTEKNGKKPLKPGESVKL